MKKEEIRKEFFKLKFQGNSYAVCTRVLKAKLGYEVSERTLQRWNKKLNEMRDESTRPRTIHKKITSEMESEIVKLRKETGWGEKKIESFIDLSHGSVGKVLNKHNLTNPNSRRKKRLKYIRWQRKHPNSLWQMDVSDQKIKDKYCFAVVDDCSRYCIGLIDLNRVTTSIVTKILDDMIKFHGKPREILTDNGPQFGLRSKHSKFDRWCRRRGIKHIRTALHSPTTTGKIERFFQTLGSELKFCKSAEHFRMRYNHFRPHTSLHGKVPASVYFRG